MYFKRFRSYNEIMALSSHSVVPVRWFNELCTPSTMVSLRYGEMHPLFFVGSLAGAVEEATTGSVVRGAVSELECDQMTSHRTVQ